MKITDLKFGSALLVDVERGGVYFTLSSKVMNYDDAGVYVLPPYTKEGQINNFKERDSIHIRHIDMSKVFQWKCTEWKEVTENALKLVYLQVEEGVAKNANKREAFRLEVNIDINIKSTAGTREYKGYLKDISQLGLGFITNYKFDTQDTFDITFEDIDMEIPLRIKIIRQVEIENGCLYGCVIIQSTPILRKYIAQKQLLEMRKQRI